jgi:hypothetical protein
MTRQCGNSKHEIRNPKQTGPKAEMVWPPETWLLSEPGLTPRREDAKEGGHESHELTNGLTGLLFMGRRFFL